MVVRAEWMLLNIITQSRLVEVITRAGRDACWGPQCQSSSKTSVSKKPSIFANASNHTYVFPTPSGKEKKIDLEWKTAYYYEILLLDFDFNIL